MSGQQQGGGGADNSTGVLWALVGVMCVILAVWFFLHDQLVTGYFAIKSFEISIISLFVSSLGPLQQSLETVNVSTVTFGQVANVATMVGDYLKYPVIVIMAFLAVILYSTSTKTAFRKIYSMTSLLNQERENWPVISPVVGLDLVNTDIDEGPWAMFIPPMDFAKKNKLLRKEFKPTAEGKLDRTQKIEVTIIKSKANQVFVQQLGQPFRGVEKMPIHYRALFAIFAAKANADRDNCDNMLHQIAISAERSNKLNFSGADALLKKHLPSKVVQKIVNNHAYELTLMATMLGVARMDGVIASAQFLWLKPYDRSLWYVLNTVGRRTAPPETAGVFAHWLAEKAIGRKLTVPMVEQATIALDDAVKEIIYIPDEDEV